MKFRKKPIEIEAMQWTGGNLEEIGAFMPEAAYTVSGERLTIATLEGAHLASLGDWIIKGVHGEYYPCKPDIFAKTYESCDPLIDITKPEEVIKVVLFEASREYIQDELGDTEILAGLAEECVELGQAALKLRRVLDGKNPTPKTLEEVKENLLEEIADVFNCISELSIINDDELDAAMLLGEEKIIRWAERLRDASEEREAKENERIHED